MNGSPIIIESDSEGTVSSFLKMGMESEFHFSLSVNGDFELGVKVHLEKLF